MSNPALFILPPAEKFDGLNWLEWKTTITNAAKAKGLLGYIDGSIKCPKPPDPNDTPAPPTPYWGSFSPTYEEWLQRDAYAQGMITLNVTNPIGQGVTMDGASAASWASLATIRDAQTDLGLINAEEKLGSIKYSEGTDIEKHIADMREAWSKANGQGADISDKKFRTYILKSMPRSWSVLVGSLMAETTSAEVITRLATHALIIGPSVDVSPSKSAHALSAQAGSGGRRPVRHPELKCTNLPNCGRIGHTTDQCYRPGGGLAGQYPEWWKGSKGNSPNTPNTTNTPAPTANSAITSATNSASEGARCLAFSVIDQRHDGARVSYADSAASRHFFVERADFETYESIPESNETGTTASGGGFEIMGKGRVRKSVKFDGEIVELTFDDALHAPKLEHNLVSIGCLAKKGCSITFDGSGAVFFDPAGQPFMRGTCHDSTMYRVDFISPQPTAMSARSLKHPVDMETWHRRLGHVGESILREMVQKEMVTGLDVTKKSVNGRCESCIMGKQTRRPFDDEITPEHEPNERVSFDLWGPARTQTTGGKVYMMLGCDQGGAGTKGWFLADKRMETTVTCLEAYHVESERQTGKKLRRIRTDEGPEFINSVWAAYTAKFGIIHETTAPHSSAANGVVERMNRTVLDRGRSMIDDSGLPAHYWGEAMATSLHVADFIPSSRHAGRTPLEIREGRKPDVSYLRPFGCTAYAKVPKEDGGSKLDMRSIKGVMVGYFGRGDYKILDRSNGRIFRSRDVIFEEGRARRTLEQADDTEGGNTPTDTSTTILDASHEPAAAVAAPPGEPDAPLEPRRSTRLKAPSAAATEAAATEEAAAVAAARGLDWARTNKVSTNTALSAAVAMPDDSWIPKSYREAITRPDLWKHAMDEEMARMHERSVWKLVERPEGARTMKNRWTFALKYNEDGAVIGRKARLVAKGFSQIPGVDFFASYASVVKYESLRINLALGTFLNWEIWQIDYSSAYLNAPNQVPILMEQPEGYEMTRSQVLQMDLLGGKRAEGDRDAGDAEDKAGIVALVDKALYGTMDGAYNWWKALDEDMARVGYRRSRADPSVRSRTRESTGERTVCSTYSDDTSGMSSSADEATLAVAELGEKYGIKDLGNIKLVLGIRITRDRDQRLLTMDQEEYLKRILDRHKMTDCAPKHTPLPAGVVLNRSQAPATPEDHEFMKDKCYSEVLGAIMYAQIGTRPDLSFAIATLSRFASNPGKAHWQALMHVMQYIKATLHYKLRYGGANYDNCTPHGYADSDFAACTDTRRSVSGHVFIQAGGPTCWGSKYQSTVATSTTEAEYMAMSRAVEQVQWMFSSLSEIDFPQPRPAIVRADNNGAISIAENKRNHNRVKHIDVRHHFIRERAEAGDVKFVYVPSTENIADLFTKALPRPAHLQMCVALRLVDT